eukprot:scaffold19179_cov35-Tisochrysis_lutea.AAC.4
MPPNNRLVGFGGELEHTLDIGAPSLGQIGSRVQADAVPLANSLVLGIELVEVAAADRWHGVVHTLKVETCSEHGHKPRAHRVVYCRFDLPPEVIIVPRRFLRVGLQRRCGRAASGGEGPRSVPRGDGARGVHARPAVVAA